MYKIIDSFAAGIITTGLGFIFRDNKVDENPDIGGYFLGGIIGGLYILSFFVFLHYSKLYKR